MKDSDSAAILLLLIMLLSYHLPEFSIGWYAVVIAGVIYFVSFVVTTILEHIESKLKEKQQ